MKLVIAIVQDQDELDLGNAFREAKIPATKLSTTGGFLKSGNTTFLCGVEDDQVEKVLETIEYVCKRRDQVVTYPSNMDVNLELASSFPVRVEVGGGIVFVVPVDQFHRI